MVVATKKEEVPFESFKCIKLLTKLSSLHRITVKFSSPDELIDMLPMYPHPGSFHRRRGTGEVKNGGVGEN